MNINEIIKYPILTEKTYSQMANNVYTFAVDRRTNRAEVKKAVEFIFKVEVEKVNIFNVAKKPKRLGRFQGFTNSYKKAIITLKDGHSIKIFEDELAEAQAVETKVKEEKTVSAAEEKAAAKIAAKAAKKENK